MKSDRMPKKSQLNKVNNLYNKNKISFIDRRRKKNKIIIK